MSYIINWSSQLNGDTSPQPTSIGKETITIVDSTTDSSTPLTLTGKNWSGYGAIQQENFIRLMENFASEIAPTPATVGQLWYQTSTQALSIYVNTTAHPTGQWEVLYSFSNPNVAYPTLPIIQSTPPSPEVGVFWYNTTTNIISIYTGTNTIPGAPAATGGWTPLFSTGGSSVTSLLGTANQIATSGAGTVTVGFAPNVVIPAPTSGYALEVEGTTVLGYGLGGSYAAPQLMLTTPQYGIGVDVSGNFLFKNINNGVYNFYNLNGTVGVSVTATGSLSISAPLSGNAIDAAGTISGMLFAGSGASLTNIPNTALVNSGVTIAAGTGISGGGTVVLGGTVTLTNAGVTHLTAGGAGLSVSATTGNITITNTGVTSLNAGGGISVSAGTGPVTITNSGVTAIVAGTNISISSATGGVTISVAGTVAAAQLANTVQTNGAGAGTFHWAGQAGQPTWLWGSNTGTDFYVWNPANFSVNYANSAGTATSATDATNATYAATQAASTNNTTIATTAFVQALLTSGVSLAGNGYANFTSGLQLRWGTVAHTVAANQAHAFSVPFSTACLVVIPVVASSTGAEFFTVVAGSQTATGWTQYSNNTTNINYIAIGH